MPSRILRVFSIVAGLVPFACSDGQSGRNADTGGLEGDGGGGGETTCSAEGIARCLVDQMACSKSGNDESCTECPVGQYAQDDGVCGQIQGMMLSHEFAEFSVGPGEEVKGLCQSWTLENDTELWVNAVELTQDEQSHHSNWLFVPDDKFPGPDGVWPCADRDYSQLQAAVFGGVLYAQSTQARREVQKFPEGVAVRIPPRSRIIGDVHLLNTSTEEVSGSVSLDIYTIDVSEVKVKLAPFHLTYDELAIPPRATSRFTGECEIDSYYQDQLGHGMDGQIYFILPHTHALGTRYFLEVLGGPNDGQSIIDLRGFNSEARGRPYDPPIDVTGASGFRFGCEFENPRDETVHWGFDDQEMCENLGFMASDLAFESRVSTADPVGEEDGIQLFTGACSTVAFPFGQDKPGGPTP